jgi:hypothetical protein
VETTTVEDKCFYDLVTSTSWISNKREVLSGTEIIPGRETSDTRPGRSRSARPSSILASVREGDDYCVSLVSDKYAKVSEDFFPVSA